MTTGMVRRQDDPELASERIGVMAGVAAVPAVCAVRAVIGGHLMLGGGGMRRDVVVVMLRVVVHGQSPGGDDGYSPPVWLKALLRSIRSACR